MNLRLNLVGRCDRNRRTPLMLACMGQDVRSWHPSPFRHHLPSTPLSSSPRLPFYRQKQWRCSSIPLLCKVPSPRETVLVGVVCNCVLRLWDLKYDRVVLVSVMIAFADVSVDPRPAISLQICLYKHVEAKITRMCRYKAIKTTQQTRWIHCKWAHASSTLGQTTMMIATQLSSVTVMQVSRSRVKGFANMIVTYDEDQTPVVSYTDDIAIVTRSCTTWS